MTEIQKMREWLLTYPGMPQDDKFQIDYYSNDPSNASLTPNGLIEVGRNEYNDGMLAVTNQLNFNLEIIMSKPPDHSEDSASNAEWLLNLQKWVQRQSVLRKAPTFGNIDQHDEVIRAQNGSVLESVDEGGVFLYLVTISVQYREEIKEDE